MTKREFKKTPKPTLEAVLDWAEVEYNPERGKQMCRCPLHEDRTPSCSVDLTDQLWKCQSCGKGGDSFTLIMEKAGVNFVGACGIASAQSFAAGVAGGSDDSLPGLALGRGGGMAGGSGSRSRGPAFKPTWRRG